MDNSRRGKQIRLAIFDNEPLARLAEQRLLEENIPCVVRSLGAGPGVWGVATNMPHALYVKADDEMRAREVLDLDPAELEEREEFPAPPAKGLTTPTVAIIIVLALVLLFGVVEVALKWVI